MLRVTYKIDKLNRVEDVQCGDDKIYIAGERIGECLHTLHVNLKTNKVKEHYVEGSLFFEEKGIPYYGGGLFYTSDSGITCEHYNEEKEYFITRIGDIGYRVELINNTLEITDLLEHEKETYDLQDANIPLDNIFMHNHEWCYTNSNDSTVRKIEDNSLVDIPYNKKYYSSLEYCCYVDGGKLVVMY